MGAVESQYNGPAEILFDGAKQFDAVVRITRRTEMHRVETLDEAGGLVEGTTSWDGFILSGVGDEDLRSLQALERGFDLRVPVHDRTGRASLPDGRNLTYLAGAGEPPF